MDLVPIHIYILHQNIMEIWRVKINEPQIHADDFLYVVKVKIALSINTLRWAINKKQEHKYWNKLSGINIEGWIYYIFEWVVVITTLNYLMKICIEKESFSSLGFKYTYVWWIIVILFFSCWDTDLRHQKMLSKYCQYYKIIFAFVL